MKLAHTYFLISALLISNATFADAYKCIQNNKSVIFQDQPCKKGAAEEQITLKSSPNIGSANEPPPLAIQAPVQPHTPSNTATPAEPLDSAKSRQEKQQECASARAALETLKIGRPIYTVNDKGGRDYISDKDRPNHMEAVKRDIAILCKK